MTLTNDTKMRLTRMDPNLQHGAKLWHDLREPDGIHYMDPSDCSTPVFEHQTPEMAAKVETVNAAVREWRQRTNELDRVLKAVSDDPLGVSAAELRQLIEEREDARIDLAQKRVELCEQRAELMGELAADLQAVHELREADRVAVRETVVARLEAAGVSKSSVGGVNERDSLQKLDTIIGKQEDYAAAANAVAAAKYQWWTARAYIVPAANAVKHAEYLLRELVGKRLETLAA